MKPRLDSTLRKSDLKVVIRVARCIAWIGKAAPQHHLSLEGRSARAGGPGGGDRGVATEAPPPPHPDCLRQSPPGEGRPPFIPIRRRAVTRRPRGLPGPDAELN